MNRGNIGKRKAPLGGGFNRRVRARKEQAEPEEYHGESQSENDDASEDEDGPVEMKSSRKAALEQYSDSEDQDRSDQDQDANEDDMSQNSDDGEPEPPSVAASQISFGALAKVQAELPNARKNKKKNKNAQDSDEDDSAPEEHHTTTSHREEESKSRRAPVPSRAHKHAPTEQSSKRAVTRKRDVIGQTVTKSRDPRFDSMGDDLDNDRLRKRYDFLEKYRDDELATMKRTLKDATMAAKGNAKTKAQKKKLRDAPQLSEHERENLKREIASIESRKASQAAKDRHKELLDEHRKKEKELVKQGKTPYYLKKADQKKQVLVDRFSSMKKSQVDRAIERKRKKVVAKERRDMPWARRSAME